MKTSPYQRLRIRQLYRKDDALLTTDVTKEVDCERKSQNGDVVSVHYVGSLDDGTVFDSSYERGTPIQFELGAGRVIKGWDIGVEDMCIGEKRTLVIPPEFGYGSRGIGPIPGNAELHFDVELVGILGVTSPEKDEL